MGLTGFGGGNGYYANENKAKKAYAKDCVFTFCNRPQGGGTWIDVMIDGERKMLEVCEQHWQANRLVTS